MAGYTQEEYKLAREVNLVDFLIHNGYEMEKSGNHDYQLKLHDSLKVATDGSKWVWHSKGTGGKSQIELIKQLEGINTIEAIKKLAEFATGGSSPASDKATPMAEAGKEFILPEKWTNNKRADEYLTKTRGIDPEIVNFCLESGLIYESKKFHNVVFVGQKHEDGEVKYASLRGTYTTAEKPFKGDVTGSDKRYSFAMEGSGKSLYVYESAIDALSDASMEKAEGKDWRLHHRATLGGMSDKSLELYLKRHPEIKEITFRLDNDIDGKDKDGNPRNPGQIRAAALMEKYKGQGYEVNNSKPVLKDINADLLARSPSQPEAFRPVTPEVKEEPQGIDSVMEKLAEGVKSVFTSQEYLTYLSVLSKFHRYSINNCMLIKLQMPSATMVAGYNAWKKDFERQVRKGEKGITVLAPQEYKYVVKQKEIDKETGKEIEKPVERKGLKFIPVTVFDVSQTEGKEIPSLTKELSFPVEQAKIFIDAITNIAAEKNVTLEFEKISNGSKGYFSDPLNKIAIKEGMSDAQTIKTAVHELCHSRLHSSTEDGPSTGTRREKEVQAESVAYIVADHFGIDTSEYSFPYIASWSSGKDVEELKASLNEIKKEASSVITELETEVERLKEKELSLSGKTNTVAVKNTAIALELYQKDVPLFIIDKEGKLVSINTKKDFENNKENILITTGDLEKNKESIPEVYDRYLVSLFQKSYEINPLETLEIFGLKYEKSELNKIALVEAPLIKEGILNAKNLNEIRNCIATQLEGFQSIPGKVVVQILKTEVDIFKTGELLDFATANRRISDYNFKIRDQGSKESITFGLYVQDKNRWKYGVSRFDAKDVFAEDLIDFVEKTMDKNVLKICEKELAEKEKALSGKGKNKEENRNENCRQI